MKIWKLCAVTNTLAPAGGGGEAASAPANGVAQKIMSVRMMGAKIPAIMGVLG
jgi:hypothetical protein